MTIFPLPTASRPGRDRPQRRPGPRLALGAAVIAAATITWAAPAAAAPRPCELKVVKSTRLTTDVRCNIWLMKPGVVFDLGGHKVTGFIASHPSAGVGSVRVTNGTVVGTINIRNASSVRIDRLTVLSISGRPRLAT